MTDDDLVRGCATCWPDDPNAAWANFGQLEPISSPIERLHVALRLSRCNACGQGFVCLFTEVALMMGEDLMAWKIMPISQLEISALQELGPAAEDQLEPIGANRRVLTHHYPDDKADEASWQTGFSRLPHD